MSLKNKVLNYLNTNKSAQGSLVAVVAASVILSVIVASATQWYLAFNKSLNVSGDSLTGMSIAKDIWDKMTTQDFEDMKAKAGTTETNNVGGYTVTKEYGNAGVFDESTGECKVGSSTPTAENPRACMDVTIKVTDKDGKQVFTATPTRVSQNMGNFYVKNGNFPKDFQVKLEDEDETAEIPEGKALYAYVDGQKVPLSSQADCSCKSEPTIGDLKSYDKWKYDAWCGTDGFDVSECPDWEEYTTAIENYIAPEKYSYGEITILGKNFIFNNKEYDRPYYNAISILGQPVNIDIDTSEKGIVKVTYRCIGAFGTKVLGHDQYGPIWTAVEPDHPANGYATSIIFH